MTTFTDRPKPEREPFKCPCCQGDTYKEIFIETNKSRYKTTKMKSGFIKVSKIRKVDVLITKDFAECLSCSFRTLLDTTEEVVPKETKAKVVEKLAETKFDKHFLNPGG